MSSANSSSESGRSYTSAQESVVQRVFDCDATAYYAILGVEQDADADEIKRAFKSLALLLHPDKNAAPQAEEAFKLVRQAWEVLSDDQERAAYDNERRAGGFEFSSFFPSSSSFTTAADDYWSRPQQKKDRNPPRPRNETRKQRRRRKYEERMAHQPQQEQERASEAAEIDAEELLRRFAREAGRRGLRFWYCRQCDDVHIEGDVHIQSQSQSRRSSHSHSQSAPVNSHSKDSEGGVYEALCTLVVMAAGLLLILYALYYGVKLLFTSTFGKIVLGIAGILATVLYFVPDHTPPPQPPSPPKTRTFYRRPTPYP